MKRLLLIGWLLGCSLAGAQVDQTPFPTPPSKKGLQVQMIPDAIALGTHHATLNVSLGGFMDLENHADSVKWTSAGKEYSFRKSYLTQMDRDIKALHDGGAVVYLILLAYPSKNPAKDALLVHPQALPDYKYNIAAFNTKTPEGKAWFQALMEFLTQRYSGKSTPQGRVWGYIVGNEVNSHWMWYNCGKAPLASVVQDYADAVRCVHSALRKSSAHARVYLSFDHHWTASMPGISELEATAGKSFLDTFAKIVREQGDFDWHVATHPYPDDLGNPRTWLDQAAPPHENAKHITFKNLEVMNRYMERPELLFAGKPRRIILSEQGFHCLTTPDGETLQAAAYAYAWEKTARANNVDAFILHRHVDHKHEGGLRLGLWERKPESIAEPGRKRLIYELYQAAGTPAWPEKAAFALPIVGLKSWDELK
jgi:hypothetical protein